MAQIIPHALASVTLFTVAFLPITPATAQTQQQLNWCLHKDDTFSPTLRIEGCSGVIRSGHQVGKDLSRVFYNRAIAYVKKGEYDRAIADFNQAIRLEPDSVFALNNRGAAYARKGQFDEAIADFNEAIRIDASNAISYNNRGIAYAKKGLYDRAIEDFDQAIRFDPKDASALKNRSLAKQLIGSSTSTNTEIATAAESRNRAGQMRETLPRAETLDSIEANASAAVNPIEQKKDTPPLADPPSINTNNARVLQKPSAIKPLKDTVVAESPKVAPVAKLRKPIAAKSSRPVRVAHKSKTQHTVARTHKARSQPALVRFFRKLDFRKVFRVASRKSSSSQRASY